MPRKVLTINLLGNFLGNLLVLEHNSLKCHFFKKIKAKSLKTKNIQKHKKYFESTNKIKNTNRENGSLRIDPLKTSHFPKIPYFNVWV